MGESLSIHSRNGQAIFWLSKVFKEKRDWSFLKQDKQKTKDIAKLTSEIDFLYTQMNDFESKEGKLIQEFGDRVTYDLNGFYRKSC